MNVNSFVLIYKRRLLSLMIKPPPCEKDGHAGQIITLMPPIRRLHGHTRADFFILDADYTIRLRQLMKIKQGRALALVPGFAACHLF